MMVSRKKVIRLLNHYLCVKYHRGNSRKMKQCLLILGLVFAQVLCAQNTNLDNLLTQTQWDSLFPKRAGTFGTHPQGYTTDFYSFAKLKQAANDLADYKVTIRKKIGVWGELTTVTRISTNTTYNYSDVDAWWHTNTTAETVIQVNFKDFVNRVSTVNNKRELAAFLANISKETTGGWQTPVGGGTAGDYAQWGLFFVHEVGYSSTTSAGTYSQAHAEYPPNSSKSYYGRGPIQLSWNYNYGQFSKFIFNDKNVLLNNPDTLQKDGVLAFKSAIWFWMMPQCPKPSCHQVMHDLWLPVTGEYSANKMFKKGFAHTNNIINGGLECRTGSSAAFTAKVALRSDLYKFYLGIAGFNATQIAAENTGNNSTLCYESSSNAMQDYVNCAVVVCTPTVSNRTKTICSNETYFYNQQTLSMPGIYKDTFLNANGCDSVETLTLMVNQTKKTTINQSICLGDSVKFKNVYRRVAGLYQDTLLSHQGCDSILELILSIKSISKTTINKTICAGDSVLFNNQYLKLGGTYLAKFQNSQGCDSIIELILIIKPKTFTSISKNICKGDSIFFNNQYLKLSGTYQAKYQNQQGCDSLINLNLTVNPLPIVSISKTNNQLIATSGFSKYRWFFNSTLLGTVGNIHQASQTGNYTVEAESAVGCINRTSVNYIKSLTINGLSNLQIEIYPSPSTGIVFIKGLKDPSVVKVYDIMGTKLMEKIVENYVDLSNLSNGFYWIEFSNWRAKIFLNK